ncbi:MAG: M1 family aminopeptidase, partial [bacterium]
VKGTSALTLTPLSSSISSFKVDSGPDLVVESVTINGAITQFRVYAETLEITLPRAFSPGEKIIAEIRYHGSPRAGLYFIIPDKGYPNRHLQVWSQGETESNHLWFPVYDYPNDFATSEMIATVPSSMTVISNGKLLEVAEPGPGLKTYHWLQDLPHATYLISICVGEYEEWKDQWNDVPLTGYVFKGDLGKAPNSFRNTKDMMEFISQRIGVKYPWAKYSQTVVTDFVASGMENVSATTLTERTLHDDRAHGDVQSESLLSHELAHQWFGDLLTCRDWLNTWLNEGFATYFQSLYFEHWRGKDEFLLDRVNSANGYINSSQYTKRPIVDYRLNQPFKQFDSHDYAKGSWVLHMLRRELGDELFWKAIKLYVTRNAHKTVITSDLQRAIEDATGRNFDWFFQQWVYSPGHPEIKASWDYIEKQHLVHLNLQQTQKTDDGTPVFVLDVPVQFWDANGTYTAYTLHFDKAAGDFYFVVPDRPVMVQVDPDRWVLMKLDFSSKPTAEWVTQLKHAKNAVDRMDAMTALSGKWNDTDVMPALLAALNDSFYAVRRSAADAVGKSGRDDAYKALTDALVTEADSRVRQSLTSALGNFDKNPEVPPLLKTLLTTDNSYYVRANALRALGKINEKDNFDVIKDALKQESHQDVIRGAVFDVLGDSLDERGLALAADWSAYGRPVAVRSSAISALAKYAKPKAGDKPTDPQKQIRDSIVKMLDDPIVSTRYSVIAALGSLADPDTLKALQKTADQDPDRRVRQRAKDTVDAINKTLQASPDISGMKKDITDLKTRLDALEKLLNQLNEKFKAASPEENKS